MEALKSTLAFKRVPTVEVIRKKEQSSKRIEQQQKRPRLLDDLLTKRALPSLVPSFTTEGIPINPKKCSKWKIASVPLANRKAIESVKHWEKEGSTPLSPPNDVSVHPTCVIDYTEEEFINAKCKNDSWDKKSTDFLFMLCRNYNLRWPMIIDMINTRFNYILEVCQLRYYTVSKLVLKYRKDLGRQLTNEEEQLLNYSFDMSLYKNRRLTLDRSFMLSSISDDSEKMLLKRMQEIDDQLSSLSATEVTNGYGPFDDLDAIPTVLKEPPVYLKPTPGVSLRSARFDNTTASGFFADNTQRRLLQILGEMNVLIPRMATRRVCDTLDRLKQHIVKLILLRKYFAQNNFNSPVNNSLIYQNAEMKKRRKMPATSSVYLGAPPKNYSRYLCLFIHRMKL